MIRPEMIVGSLIGVVVVGWGGWRFADASYFAPRADLTERIKGVNEKIEAAQRAVDDVPRVRSVIDSYVARTLGPDTETVDHELRTHLNRIAEAVGLAETRVGTGGAKARSNPAKSQFSRSLPRAERDRPDFVEVTGTITGEGDLATVVELIDRIDAAPFLKHLDHVRIQPMVGAERFDVSVGLTTIFLPGLAPEAIADVEYDRGRLERYAGLLGQSPFRVPDPPAPPPAPPPVAPETERPSFPWSHWMVTGVARGSTGPEAWLRNRNSGETRRLSIGGALDAATLIGVGADEAEFRLGEEVFTVQVGSTMDRRTKRP